MPKFSLLVKLIIIINNTILTCLDTNRLISSSVMVEPVALATNATGTSPARSSFMLKMANRRRYISISIPIVSNEERTLHMAEFDL